MDKKAIKIIDNISGEILLTEDFENMDRVYAEATKFEEMGLDIRIEAPSVSQSLISSLGANEDDIARLKQSELEEIDSHNEPTCHDNLIKH